jgi:hypothetical protein
MFVMHDVTPFVACQNDESLFQGDIGKYLIAGNMLSSVV